ncbi:Uu.00g049100.m01.CDS01 [Anthostomella pinea]|uniref:Uu.00g049100.m01.CDS01 n=1 Tax=Anthostomella pinea TaxID=933095 RepID=A0AAI8VCD7_9PEZI|nr:Uu.00g049100.m01.CDS01 [Anthostomella pinea]
MSGLPMDEAALGPVQQKWVYTAKTNKVNPGNLTCTPTSMLWLEPLEQVQYHQSEWVGEQGVQQSVNFRHSFLPDAVRKLINVIPSATYGMWNEIDGEEVFKDALENAVDRGEFFTNIRAAKYSLWAINTGNHWKVIYLRLAPSQPSGEYDTLVDLAIVDPQKSKELTAFVRERLFIILDTGGIDISAATQQKIRVPRQRDSFSCGLRTAGHGVYMGDVPSHPGA